LTLIGLFSFLIFLGIFVKQFWSLYTNIKMKRELSHHSHIIATSMPCHFACPRHWANIFVNMWICGDVTTSLVGF